MTPARNLSRTTFLASVCGATAALHAPAAGAAEPVQLGIQVTSHPALEYAIPIVVAQQLGYTAKEGINIRTIAGSAGGGTEIRSLTQGGLDLGMVSTSAAIKAILAGEDLKIVGGGAQTAGTLCWVVKKDSPIKTIHDLIGKKVGYTSPGSVSETALILSLEAAKIDPSTVQTTSGGGVGGNMTLLSTGGLDCAFTLDPTLAQFADQVRVVFWARDYLPHFMQNVWVATSEVVRKNMPALGGFFRAWARGVDYVQGHPLQSARI